MKSIYTKSRRWCIIICFLIAFPFIVAGYHFETLNYANRIEDWLPKGFEETRQLQWLKEQFGVTDVIAVAWDSIKLGDPKIDEVATALSHLSDAQGEPYFQKVTTADELLKRFPNEVPPEERPYRLEGWLLGSDLQKTCIACLVADAGYIDRANMIDRIFETTENIVGVPQPEIRVAGPIVDSVSLDRISVREVPVLTTFSFALLLTIIWLGFRNIRLSFYCFMVAVTSEILSFALLYYTGTPAESVSLLMSTLVFVVGISGTILLTRYYVDTAHRDGIDGAPERAVQMGIVPGFLSALTTVIGIGSLAVSQIIPIARFGLFSAITIAIEFCMIFLLLPSLWAQFRLSPNDLKNMPVSKEETAMEKWSPLVRFTHRFRYALILFSLVAICVAAVGIRQIKTTIRIHGLIRPQEKIIQDYAWLEKNIGALIPIELVVTLPRDEKTKILEELETVQTLRNAAMSVSGIESSIAADTFLPEIPAKGTVRNTSRRTVYNKKVEESNAILTDGGFLRRTADKDHWRITLKVSSTAGVDYGEVMQNLRAEVGPLLKDLNPLAEIRYTGAVPLVYQTQEQLLKDLITSFITAFVLVAITMMLLLFPWKGFLKKDYGEQTGPVTIEVLKAIGGGLVAMIPALVPCMIVFGTLGYIHYAINLGVVMTASVALGIAVDGTIHFLTWFRRGTLMGKNRLEAVQFAFTRCGVSIIQTAVVCCVGFLVFAFSSFIPTVLFSYFMTILLASALVGVLLILPALLISPLGSLIARPRFFEKKPR